MFNCKPIVAYKKPSNLIDKLIHSQLNRTVNAGSVSKCNRPRWSQCSSIVESNSYLSTTASACFSVRENFTCASSEVIYLITCKKCNIQYVGQTQQKCSQRMRKHKFDIKHFPDIISKVSEHFNSPGHSIKKISLISNWQLEKAYEGHFLDASSWNTVFFWFEFQNNVLSHHKVFTDFNLFCKTLVSLSVICIF